MKKKYINPVIAICVFDNEKILTDSSKNDAVRKANEYLNNEAERIGIYKIVVLY